MNIDDLLIEEKQKRLAQDGLGGSKICCEILTYFKEKGDWDAVIEHLVLLTKKRGQIKLAITNMVQLVIKWMEETTNMDLKLRLIKDLCDVTEGKITVEVERARVVRTHARLLEQQGKVEEAARLLQEVQVETYGSMDRRERAEYILDQMRLVLAINDFIRCQIVSKKLSPKTFNDEDFADIKLRYYTYMCKYWEQEENRLELAKAFQQILDIPTEKAEELKIDVLRVFSSMVLCLFLAPQTPEQLALIESLKTNDKYAILVQRVPLIERFLDLMHGGELVSRPVLAEIDAAAAQQLRNHPIFTDAKDEFDLSGSGEARWAVFEQRIIEHNVRLIAKSFSRVTLTRFASLLALDVEKAEAIVSDLVVEKSVVALIDRPAGIIEFGGVQQSTELLDKWVNNVNSILDLVEETGHLIQKERMIAAVRSK